MPQASQWQRPDFAGVAALGHGQFATAAAQVHQQQRGRTAPQVSGQAQVNEAPFFQPGDYFYCPAGSRPDPFAENMAVAALTQGAGGHHADTVHGVALHGTVKTAQHFECLSHGLGAKVAIAKDTLAQPRYFAVLEKRDEASFAEFGYAEAD